MSGRKGWFRVPRACLALALLTPLLPWARVVVAQGVPEGPTAFWRMRSVSWMEGWGDELLRSIQFVPDAAETGKSVGFAVTGSKNPATALPQVGEPSLLETREYDDQMSPVPLADTWAVAQRDLAFEGLGFKGGATFSDSLVGVAFGAPNPSTGANAGVWNTPDGGRTWAAADVRTRTGDPVKVQISDFAFTTTDGNGVVGVGKNAVIVSNDKGVTWARVDNADLPPAMASDLTAVAFLPEDPANHGNEASLAAENALGVAVAKNGKVFTTTSGGKSWSLAHTFSGLPTITDQGLMDVALIRDSEPASEDRWNGTLAVAVGARATIAYSRDGGAWSATLSNRDNDRLPVFNGVTLTDGAGEPTGYAVGIMQRAPVILEMAPGDPATWAPALVDPRAAAFMQDFPANSFAPADANAYALHSVATMPGNEGKALAVGSRLMLERTPLDGSVECSTPTTVPGEPPSCSSPFVDDTWWQCAPPRSSFPSQIPSDETVDPAYGEVSGQAPCAVRGEKLTPSSSSPFDARVGTQPCFSETDGGPSDDALPCRARWVPTIDVDAQGNPKSAGTNHQAIFFDDDVAGEGRRLIAVGKEQSNSARVFMFDPDTLEQRGVRGFGTGFGGVSAHGARTGFVDLGDSPVNLPGTRESREREAMSDSPLAAYDSEQHRLYLGASLTKGPNDFARIQKISVLSLTGEFMPRVFDIPPLVDPSPAGSGRTNVALSHLGFDSRHGMLYAVTESNFRWSYGSNLPDWSDAAQVTLRAYRAGTGGNGGDLTLSWALPLDGRCRSTRVAGGSLKFLGVSGDGRALAFACQGLAGPHFGSPPFEANTVVTVRLNLAGNPERDHPAKLSPGNPGDLTVDAEPVAGTTYYTPTPSAMGVEARSVLAWNQSHVGANLWDYVRGGWIGALPFNDILAMGGFDMDETNPWRGRLYVYCGVDLRGDEPVRGCVDFDPQHDQENDGRMDDREPAMLAVDTLNVPAQVPAGITEKLRLPKDFPVGFPFVVAIPPRAPGERPQLFLGRSSGPSYILEDPTPPAGEFAVSDPGTSTRQDVPEEESASVTRIGYGSAYGARVWWTGLGTATALWCQQVTGSGQALGLLAGASCGDPTLTYDWATDPDATSGGLGALSFPHGQFTSAVAGPPGGGQRELRLGAVQRAELDNTTSGERSQAQAVGLFYDGGPAHDEKSATGDDAHRRRGEDPHTSADGEIDVLADEFEEQEDCASATTSTTRPLPAGVTTTSVTPPPVFVTSSTSSTTTTTTTPEQGCRKKYEDFRQGHADLDEGIEDFDVHFAEFVDRGMREVDGERQIHGGCDDPGTEEQAEDCFEEFDSDPRNDPRSPLDGESLGERAGLTLASECLDPGTKDADFQGSAVECAPGEFGRTEASAGLDPLSLVPKEASGALELLSVGETGSRTWIVRDADLGLVVETVAWATDIELRVAGGTLRIGEVRSRAWAQAKGVDDSARSELEVSFADVEITGPTGQSFACGRTSPGTGVSSVNPEVDPSAEEPVSGLPSQETIDGDKDGFPDACDPHEVVDAIGQAFLGKVQATTSAQDTNPKITGSDNATRGAVAIVRRDPVDELSDEVINQTFGVWELPALQLTIVNDGLQTNRIQVGFAAVFAESNYKIGDRRVDEPEEPGAVTVELTDLSGTPLSGGGFALVADRDGDGRADEQAGECETDGSGTCGFEGLEPGEYAVEQRVAPSGYLAEQGPRSVFVSEGATETVEFVNGPDAAGVGVELVDPSGSPLPGGEFSLVPDGDGDGAVAPSDAVAASCVTDGAGRCGFSRVALGSWVLHQQAAPPGYQVANDVAFALTQPGQVAEIRVVNGRGVAGARVRIVTIIDNAVPASQATAALPWWAALPRGLASLLRRGWLQALLFALTGMLFGAPAYLAHRRRELVLATHRSPRP